MTSRLPQTLLLFVTMLLLQVLIFNHIVLFGVAVPFAYIYFIIRQPIGMGEKSLLTWSFLLGLAVDICCDTPGVNALACTVVAMLKRKIFFSFMLRDDNSGSISPSIVSMGFGAYLRFLLVFVATFSLLVFAIEYFSFLNVKDIIIMAASSTLFTTIVLLCIDSLTSSRRDKRL